MAAKHNLRPFMKFGHKVVNVTWQEKKKMWIVKTGNGKEFQANFFVHGTGALHSPNIPTFKVKKPNVLICGIRC